MAERANVDILLNGIDGDVVLVSNNPIDYSISKTAALMGICEGPIYSIDKILVGSTDVEEKENSNVEYLYSLGSDTATIQYKCSVDGTPAIRSHGRRLSSGVTDANLSTPSDIAFSTIQDDRLETELFDTIHSTTVLSANNSLDTAHTSSTDDNYIEITLESLSARGILNTNDEDDIEPSKVGIFLEFPGGLYRLDDKGNIIKETVYFGIQALDENNIVNTLHVALSFFNLSAVEFVTSNADLGAYYKFGVTTTNRTRTIVKVEIRIEDPSIKKLRIWREPPDAAKKLDGSNDTKAVNFASLLKYELGYEYAKLSYAGTALIGTVFTANSKSSGTLPTITTYIHGKIIDKIPIDRLSEPATPDPYNPGSNVSTFMRPFIVNNGTPEYTPVDYNARDWNNPSSWKRGFCTNPVWCLLDLLTNKVYGLGNYITMNDIDLESFFEVANWCDEPVDYVGDGSYQARYSLNLVLDSKMPVLNALRGILTSFRGLLFWRDGKLVLKADKQEQVSQVLNDIQLLNVNYSYSSPNQIYNALEVSFLNMRDDFLKYTIYLEDKDNILKSDNQVRKKSMLLAGTTDPYQAISLAKYHMLVTTNITKQLSFEASLDLFNAEIGDVIRVYTSRFANDATFSAKVKSITYIDTVGTQKRYRLELFTPVQISTANGTSSYKWVIQSTTGGNITIYPGIGSANESGSMVLPGDNGNVYDTDLTEIVIRFDDPSGITDLASIIDTTVDTMFTIYGNVDDYDDWRIVSYKIKAKENKVEIGCINYVDFYDQLDNISVSTNFSMMGRRTALPEIERVPTSLLASDNIEIFAEPYYDSINGITKLNVYFDIPGLENYAHLISQISISGFKAPDNAMKHLKTINMNEGSLVVSDLAVGNWYFKINLLDGFGRVVGSSEIIKKNFSELTVDSDFVSVIVNNWTFSNSEIVNQLIQPGNYTVSFNDRFIKLYWTNWPVLVNRVKIDYYKASDSTLIKTIEYAARPNEVGAFEIVQDAFEIDNTIASYKLVITFYNSIDSSTLNSPEIFAINTPPPAPPSNLVNFEAENTTLVIRVNDANAVNYINSVPDFYGFKGYIKFDSYEKSGFNLITDPITNENIIGASYHQGKIIIEFNFSYDPASHAIQATIINLSEYFKNNNIESTLVELWISAVDIFKQESPQTKVGSIQASLLYTRVKDEIIPEAMGNSLAINLFRNSSFEEG